MNKAIIVNKKSLAYKDFPNPKLQPKSLIIKQEVLGINRGDYQVLSGEVSNTHRHGIIGVEASGVVQEVGEGCIRNFNIGDRVCYGTFFPGAFAKYRCVHENHLMPIPRYATFQQGATLLKGLITYTLLGKVFTMEKSQTILLSGASGAIGSFVTQLASKAGFKVIALTRFDEKIEYIKSNGASHVINYKKNSVLEAVQEITKGKGVKWFFDCLGKAVEDFAFDVLSERGFFISFGEITGSASKINLSNQLAKSITVSKVNLGNFITSYQDLAETSIAFFRSIQAKVIRTHIKNYSFDEANIAFNDLSKGLTIGQKVLEI